MEDLVRRSLSFLVLYCSLSLTLVKGFYILQAQLTGYDNPNQLRFRGCTDEQCFAGCCDAGDGACTSGVRRCDTFFVFCLRLLGSSGFGCGSNSGSVMRSNVTENDATINFSRGTFLGLSNPLILQGLTDAWNGVQLYIEVRDADGNNSQLIDLFRINVLGTNLGINETYFGRLGIASITLNINRLCVQNFQGSDCTECIPGFTGARCDKNIDDCVGEMCNGNGQCVDGINSFTCICDPGFTGEDCKDNINECMDPGVNCSNGQCMDEFGSYSCICNTGYTGTLCDTDINECLSNPCGTNGQCENQEGTFNCSCDPGFAGERCQTDIDDCVGVNCSGNGECLDGVNSFICQCTPGFVESFCTEVLKIGGGTSFVSIVGGVIGGAVIFIVVVVLVTLLVVLKCRIWHSPQQLKPAISRDIEMKENEVYGVCTAALQEGQHEIQVMNRNICYATTQHMEIVGNECYGCVSETSQ